MFVGAFFATSFYLVYYRFSVLTTSIPTKQKLFRNKIYKVCGVAMLAAFVTIGFMAYTDRHASIFWPEAVAVIAFAAAWLVKGQTIFTMLKDPPATKCCKPAPPVLQFDQAGKLLRSWGGPSAGYDWPKNEHGIHVDNAGNVWIAGNDKDDHQILKFTAQGKFLQQIGKAGSTGGSNSTTLSLYASIPGRLNWATCTPKCD